MKQSDELCDFQRSSFQSTIFFSVSRIKARSDLYEMDLILDINIDIYPIAQNERLAVCLATTLNLDGSDMPTGNPGRQVYDTVIVLELHIWNMDRDLVDYIKKIL